MKKKQPDWKTNPNSFFHPNAHTAFLIVCPIVIAIAAGVFAFCFSYTYEYLTAPFHEKVQATLVDITEGTQEKWEYVETKEEQPNPNLRTTRVYTEYVYGYHWEYTVNGKTREYVSTSSSGTAHRIGDVETMLFWSRDGEMFYRSYGSGLNYILMAASAAVILAALYIIVRIIIIKIIMAREKKQKEQRREEQQSHPNAQLLNLGNYDGKRVRLTDVRGEVFEGVGDYLSKDYCEHEFGRREPCLQIANFLFYRSDVKEIADLKNAPYAAPYGMIEELNYLDGIDCIEEELLCEEDEHVHRMLLCLEEHVIKNGEPCEGLTKVLQHLPPIGLSEQTLKKAAEILEQLEKK